MEAQVKKVVLGGAAMLAMVLVGFLLLPKHGTVQSAVIPVSGMTCDGCATRITQALEELDGVTAAEVSFAKRAASVQFNPAVISETAIAGAITKLGYQAGASNTSTPPAACEPGDQAATGGCCTSKAKPSNT